LYAGPTEKQARRIAWEHFQALVPKEWVRTIRNGEGCIETVFGSRLYVGGMDRPARFEGLQWDAIVTDESSDQKLGLDRTILPMLTHRDMPGSPAWWWRIGVPKRFGPSAKEYREACESALDEGRGYTWPSSDILPREALIWAMDHMDPVDYDEQFNANWKNAGGAMFYAFDEERNVRPCSYEPRLPIIVGCDFNVDPMAWVMGHRRGRNMEWFDELWKRDTNTTACLSVLFDRYQTHTGGFEFYGDASGRARQTSASKSDYKLIRAHEGFKALGRTLHYPLANPPVKDRIAACNAMFLNAAGERKMFVDPRCKNLINDLRFRTWTTKEADLTHSTDAMGYPVAKLFPVPALIRIENQPVSIG